jgi:DNA polymerase-1
MFLGHFKQKTEERTDKGEVSIGEKTLKKWVEGDDHQISKLASLVLRYRWLDKNISSFLSDGTIKKEKSKSHTENYLDIEVDEYDHTCGKKKKNESTILQNIDDNDILHAGFNMQRVKTYRFSSSNINLQQIPIKSNPEIRPIFIPSKEGNVLAEIDYAAIHLRIAAMFSQDPVLVEMFSNPDPAQRDMHSKTASSIFTNYTLSEFKDKMKNGSQSEKDKLKSYRQLSKGVNFSLIYMAAAYTLCENSLKLPLSEGGWSYEKVCDFINEHNLSYEANKNSEIEQNNMYLSCAEFIRNRFSMEYHYLWEHQTRTIEDAKKNGYVTNLYGVRIYLPEFIHPFHEGENKSYSGYISDASNYGILSTESYIMQRAQVEMYNYFKKNRLNCRFVNQVHDSILLDLGENMLNVVKSPIKEIMTRDYMEYKGVHLDVEGEWFKFWGGKDNKDTNFNDSFKSNFWFD